MLLSYARKAASSRMGVIMEEARISSMTAEKYLAWIIPT